MRLSRSTRLLALGALLTLLPALRACTDASSVQTTEINATGSIFGTAYFDDNGNGVIDVQDPPLPDVAVLLTAAQGSQVVDQVRTDSAGFFLLTDVPVGSYALHLDTATLGDSLQALNGSPKVDLGPGDTSRVNFPVSFPVLTLEQVRATQPGQRVLTSGIALNPRLSFGDGVVHLQLDSAYLRTLNVARANIATGDSVRMLGRVKIDQGEPVLDEVTPFVLVNAATIPIPVDLSTAEAAEAKGGSLDAALVRVRTAEITDTTRALDGSFHFHIDDGSGPVEVVLRSFLQVNSTAVRPDTVVRVNQLRGLLTPVQDGTGAIHWRILPRDGGDVTLEVKNADVRVAVASDRTAASQGDTLTFTVVVTNAGPLGASGMRVIDSIPQGLTYLSSTMTRGTYDPASARWQLDSLRVGAVDTLKLRTTVTTSLVGQTVERATIESLEHEVDPNLNNNTAAVLLNLVAPTPSPNGS